jgi:hypothetical protein
MFRLTKRRKFILSSLVLSFGLFGIQLEWVTNRYLAISILALLSVPLVIWSLKEALSLAVVVTSWILPFLFTAGIGLFYFLLPSSLAISIPIIVVYFFGMYALFLSENIFSVAAIRTIQLFRSASAVSFMFTLLTSFLLFDTVWSFFLPFWLNGCLVFAISFLLFFNSVWSVNLKAKIDKRIFLYTLVPSLGLGEIAIILSFWPVTVTLSSLFLTAMIYVCLGLIQAQLSERLFEKTVKEHLAVGLAVFGVLLFYTTWG